MRPGIDVMNIMLMLKRRRQHPLIPIKHSPPRTPKMAAAKPMGNALNPVKSPMKNMMRNPPPRQLPDGNQHDRERIKKEPRRGKPNNRASRPAISAFLMYLISSKLTARRSRVWSLFRSSVNPSMDKTSANGHQAKEQQLTPVSPAPYRFSRPISTASSLETELLHPSSIPSAEFIWKIPNYDKMMPAEDRTMKKRPGVVSRRGFLKKSAAAAASVATVRWTAKSYSQIVGETKYPHRRNRRSDYAAGAHQNHPKLARCPPDRPLRCRLRRARQGHEHHRRPPSHPARCRSDRAIFRLPKTS